MHRFKKYKEFLDEYLPESLSLRSRTCWFSSDTVVFVKTLGRVSTSGHPFHNFLGSVSFSQLLQASSIISLRSISTLVVRCPSQFFTNNCSSSLGLSQSSLGVKNLMTRVDISWLKHLETFYNSDHQLYLISLLTFYKCSCSRDSDQHQGMDRFAQLS
jgi:hypothetical protein